MNQDTLKASQQYLTTGSMRARVLIVGALTLASVLTVALLPRIPQDPAYHEFADGRSMLSIPNFLNVVSNLPFLLIGIAGLLIVARAALRVSIPLFVRRVEQWPYVTFFLGVALTCVGSSYYHLSPGTARLMWDRLPMSVAFVSLVAAVMAERISVRAATVSLLPLLAAGAGSVIYWHVSEQSGSGDLRPYVVVQFYSMAAILTMIVLFRSRYTRSADLVAALLCYAAAKIAELLDAQILSLGSVVSGHTIKHLAAAASAYWIIHMLKHRETSPVSTSQAAVA